MPKLPGVFCLEGDWQDDLTSRQSVRPMLQLLEECQSLDFVHRDVATREELEHYVDRWLKERKMKRFSVAYLAFHGSPEALWLGTEQVTLSDLEDVLGARCAGKTIFLGSCSVLAASDEALKGFCQRTEAKAIVGYTRKIDYIESLAFDLILMWDLLHRTNIKSTYARLRKEHPELTRKMGLRMAHGSWASDRKIAA